MFFSLILLDNRLCTWTGIDIYKRHRSLCNAKTHLDRLFCDDVNTENQNQLKKRKKKYFKLETKENWTIIDALLLWNKRNKNPKNFINKIHVGVLLFAFINGNFNHVLNGARERPILFLFSNRKFYWQEEKQNKA